MRLLLIAVCLSLPVAAQTTPAQNTNHQTCPVEVTKVTAYVGFVKVAYHNTTDKKVIATKWQLQFVDAVGDVHDGAFTLIGGNAKPGGNGYGQHSSDFIHFQQQHLGWGLGAYLVKATFEGGGVWEDDGSHSCSGLDKGAKKRLGVDEAKN